MSLRRKMALGWGLAVACVGLVGCGPILGAVLGGIFTADQIDKSGNQAPTLALGSIVARPTPVSIGVTVTDANDDTVAVDVEFDDGSGTFQNATTSNHTVGNTKAGASLTITWDAETDLGPGYFENIRLRLVPRDGKLSGRETISSTFSVGNDPPVITDVTLDTNPISGYAVVRFTVADSASDPVDLTTFEVTLTGDFSDAQNIALTAGPAGNFPAGSLLNLPTSPSGIAHSITWDSAKQFLGDFASVALRIKVADAFSTSAFSASMPFDIDNNEAPTAAIVNVAGTYNGLVPIQFTVADAEEDSVNVLVEFSTDDRITWRPVTRAGGGPIAGLDARGANQQPLIHTVVWDTVADGVVDQSVVHVRVTPFDAFQIGTPTESVKFAVANGNRIAASFWLNRSPMPTPRASLALAETDGTIYAIGGIGFSATLSTVEAYNVATDTWRSISDMPTARSQAGAAAHGGIVYAIGGVTSVNNVVNTVGTVEAYNPTTNTWAARAAMPTPRAGFAVAAVNDTIVAIGGIVIENGSGTLSDAVEIYDPATNTWRSSNPNVAAFDDTLPALPTARVNLAAAAVNGRIYTVGGTTGGAVGDHSDALEIFDATTQTWRSSNAASLAFDANLPPLPAARQRLAVTAVGARIYAIGGAEAILFSRTEEFDTATETWELRNAMPAARHSHGAVTVWGKIIVVGGGSTTSSQIGTVDEYDPTVALWRTRATMPTPRSMLGFAALDGIGYAIGGVQFGGGGNTVFDTVEAFDPDDNTWATKTAMPTARQQLGVATAGGKIYALGGIDENNPPAFFDAVEAFDPTDGANGSWETRAPMPTPRAGMAVAEIDGNIYAIGGTSSTGATNLVEVYDPTANSWTTATAMPTPRSFASVGVVDGRIFVIGGSPDGGTTAFALVEMFDPATNTWTAKASMPTARAAAATVVMDGKIIVVGGFASPNTLGLVEVYDPAGNTWRRLPSPSVARLGAAGITIDDHGFVVGGSDNDGHLSILENLHRQPALYRVALRPAPFPLTPTVAREFAGLAATRTTVFAIGGFDAAGNASADMMAYRYLDGTVSSATRVLTPNVPYQGDTWQLNAAQTASALPALPTARGALGVALFDNGKIYAVGGLPSKSSSTPSGTVNVFDPATNAWTTATSLSIARAYFGCAATEGRVYAIGGTNGSTQLSSVEIYNPATNSWAFGAAMPTSRQQFGCVAVGPKIICAGGITPGGIRTAVVEIYDTRTNTWHTVAPLPAPRADVALIDAGHLFAVGGFDAGTHRATVFRYDFSTDTWHREADLPAGRSAMAAASVDARLGFVFGGRSGTGLVTEFTALIGR